MAKGGRQAEFDVLRERQKQAVQDGVEAYRIGEPVIFLHGRPYRDPGDIDRSDESDTPAVLAR